MTYHCRQWCWAGQFASGQIWKSRLKNGGCPVETAEGGDDLPVSGHAGDLRSLHSEEASPSKLTADALPLCLLIWGW